MTLQNCDTAHPGLQGFFEALRHRLWSPDARGAQRAEGWAQGVDTSRRSQVKGPLWCLGRVVESISSPVISLDDARRPF